MYLVDYIVICLETLLGLNKFFKAIETAVDKVYPKDYIPTLGLSSATDSGVIAAALYSLNRKFLVVSVKGIEEFDILKARIQFLEEQAIIIDTYDIDSIHNQMIKAGFEKGKGTGIGIGTPHFLLAQYCSKVLYSGICTDEYYNKHNDLFEKFLYFSNKAYSYFNIKVLTPLLDPIVVKEYSSLDPKNRIQYKDPFRMYMKEKNFPYTNSKINFEI